MKFRFVIHYHTQWGQRLFISGSSENLGEWDTSRAVPLNYMENGRWEWEGEFEAPFEYKYFILHEPSGHISWEWGNNRTAGLPGKGFGRIDYLDFWRPEKDLENTFYTSAFTRALMSRETDAETVGDFPPAPDAGTVYHIRLFAPRVSEHHRICISGNHPALGEWKEEKAVILNDHHFPLWEKHIHLASKPGIIEYKYGIYDTEAKKSSHGKPEKTASCTICPREAKRQRLLLPTLNSATKILSGKPRALLYRYFPCEVKKAAA
ncbi:MAG: carbohydrate-binding module family 20 domain-containing protein [Bacteroidia bacterium]